MKFKFLAIVTRIDEGVIRHFGVGQRFARLTALLFFILICLGSGAYFTPIAGL